MSDILKLLKIKLANYLPMEFMEFKFTDAVSGEQVSLYKQTDGKDVLANSRYSFFRVPKPANKLHYKLYPR